jgi:fucose 4-O-acetylase-like acetyltransferase
MKPEESRDRFIDLLRGGSIVAVVVGHWLVADLRWDGSAVNEQSSLRVVPEMWPLTWAMVVIPLFFFVGGFSNRHSWDGVHRRGGGYGAYLDRRVHRLLTPTLICVGVVSAFGVLVDRLGGWGIRDSGGVMFQPLWFLGVYVWVVALAPLMLSLHRRFGAGALVALAAIVALADVARLAGGWELVGYVNVLAVWLLMHQVGFWYAEDRLTRKVAVIMAVVGLAGVSVLVALTSYPATMVGVTGGTQGNMHPPTAVMALLGIGQIGVALLLRRPLLRWLQRPRVFGLVISVNLTIMTIYLWHQPALTLAARLTLPLGFPTPEAGTPGWWTWHLLWLLVPAVVLLGFVAVFGRFERVAPPPPLAPGVLTAMVSVGAVLLLGAGFLALAGSSVTEPWDPGQSLGPLTASPVWGVMCISVSALTLAALRRLQAAPRWE